MTEHKDEKLTRDDTCAPARAGDDLCTADIAGVHMPLAPTNNDTRRLTNTRNAAFGLWSGFLMENLPLCLAALPASNPRRRLAERLLHEQIERERAPADAEQVLIYDRARTAASLWLLHGAPSLSDLVAFLRSSDFENGGGKELQECYLAEVGAHRIDDLTPAQRWELAARAFETESHDEAGSVLVRERRAMGLPIPFAVEGVH
ncbi:hypothetical protein HLB44_16840 [Aquincola sp. S2]|uniref:Uncharacterized protein n=1 Tax=Pseudaquabacterium terrae TaxID=2732868 RepID=A0ABX2EJ43_9BURK|nr:hypothetical protein [Aquabacterium terrae]NRF68661.1 hypothetical protein [Aquabacterium terrae]